MTPIRILSVRPRTALARLALVPGLALAALLACRSATPSAPPSTPRLTVSVDAEALSGLQGWLEELATEGRVVGAAARVGRGGEVLFEGAAGERVQGSGDELRTDDLFRIYSMTKPITSLAAMMLVEEGRLDLDAPVAEYLPEFAHMQVAHFPEASEGGEAAEPTLTPARGPITVRQLMNHTSGLIYGIFDAGPMREVYARAGLWDPGIDLMEFARRAATLPLAAEPGTRFTYSISTDVLGAVIQVAAGVPFERFLAERVFEPLGMHDTAFTVPEKDRPRLVPLYTRSRDGLVPLPAERDDALLPDAMPSGGGGLVSTLADYGRFCEVIAGRGAARGTRLLSESTFATMVAPPPEGSAADAAFPDGLGFALGFLVVDDGAVFGAPLATGQLSWGGYASTEFFVNPNLDLYGVFLTQILPSAGEFSLPFALRVYSAVEAPSAP